jgi:CubicO group peptidase (beta-lactamase class C family)
MFNFKAHMLFNIRIFKLNILSLFIICTNFIYCQTNIEIAIKDFTKYYNATAYKQAYNLLSVDFKKQFSEIDFVTFLEKNIYQNYGECLKYNLISIDKSTYYYSYIFKYDSLKFTITINNKNEIDELSFTPFSPKLKPKREFYLSDNKLLNSLDFKIDSIVKPYMQNPNHNSLSVGILKNDTVYFYNYGEIKTNSNILATKNSIYEIGSISKTFCGNLLAQAIIEKKINLDDDIRKYLKGNLKNLQFNNQPILIKHLANHSSGLPRLPEDLFHQKNFNIKNPYSNYTNKQMLNYLSTITLNKTPGSENEYSNLGVGLLGYILEQVYQKTFSELITEKIKAPLKMKNTGVQKIKPDSILIGYENGKEVLNWQFTCLEAAGSIYSTTEDMMEYVKNNLQKNIYKELEHGVTFNTGHKIALTWHFLKRKNDPELIWHNGATGGFSSFIGLIKEKNTGFIVLTNSSAETDVLPISIYNYLKK